MINHPETGDLLAEARQVLLDNLVPELQGERKYEALMIANAMGMAVREFEQHGHGEPRETDSAVAEFLAARSLSGNPGRDEEALARAISDRNVDGADKELRALLRLMTETRLRINNPGYLKRGPEPTK